MVAHEKRLFEAIVEANQRACAGGSKPELLADAWSGSLPIVALTCIDPRLNHLLPQALAIPEERFIWLRNAGNIIFDPMSSMTRTLALACAIKGGKEIAIIGHTDCKVRQTTVLELTERFRALGIDRSRLPANLVEFFGLFASERQNVMRGVDYVRVSPLIGGQIPVHGLLFDIATGKLEWVVNGYQALEAAASSVSYPAIQQANIGEPENRAMTHSPSSLGLAPFSSVQEPKTPARAVENSPPALEPAAVPLRHEPPEPSPESRPRGRELRLDPARRFKIIGADQKVYGPVTVEKILQWLGDGRIDPASPAQPEGSREWKPLSVWASALKPPRLPSPKKGEAPEHHRGGAES